MFGFLLAVGDWLRVCISPGTGHVVANPRGISGFRQLVITCAWLTRGHPYGRDPQQVDYSVALEHRACHFSRPWFRCPRCGSLRAVIYGVASDGKFGCRRCMRLGYASEAESRIDRLNRKFHKFQARLGEEASTSTGVQLRPLMDCRCKCSRKPARFEIAPCARGASDGSRYRKVEEAVLALLYLGLHETARAWKRFDWEAMERLHVKGYITSPVSKAKSDLSLPRQQMMIAVNRVGSSKTSKQETYPELTRSGSRLCVTLVTA